MLKTKNSIDLSNGQEFRTSTYESTINDENINKKRPLGRPRTRWTHVVAKDLEAIDLTVTYESTYNREGWGDLLKAAMVLNGPVS
jgi:hypothetical protein